MYIDNVRGTYIGNIHCSFDSCYCTTRFKCASCTFKLRTCVHVRLKKLTVSSKFRLVLVALSVFVGCSGRSVGLSVGRSIGRSFSRSFGPSIGQSFGRSFSPSIGRSFGRSIGLSVCLSVRQSISRSPSSSLASPTSPSSPRPPPSTSLPLSVVTSCPPVPPSSPLPRIRLAQYVAANIVARTHTHAW